MTRTCPHHVVVVDQFNSLGAAVSCLFCSASWQMSDDKVAARWHPFESKEFGGRDSRGRYREPAVILIRRSFLEKREN